MNKLFFVALFCINLFSFDKIIALSPSINELIYALGEGNKIVANTTFCNYPKEAKNKPKVGGYFSPSLEKIVSLKPDIVIMQKSSLKLAKKLKKLGIKTKVLSLQSLQDIKTSIKEIGEILNRQKEAQKILKNLQNAINNTKNILQNKKILIVIGHNLKLDKRIFVVGQNLYLDDIITQSGNKNAFFSTKISQPVLNLENIIATNPDIVILLAPYKKQKGISDQELIKPWLKLPINAAKYKTIYVEGNEYAGIASDRLILFLKDFKRFLQDAKNKKLLQ